MGLLDACIHKKPVFWEYELYPKRGYIFCKKVKKISLKIHNS